MTNCFDVCIGIIAFLLAATIGSLLNIAYGQLTSSQIDQWRNYSSHVDHSAELIRTIGVLTEQCQANAQDASITQSCMNFFESIDKHLTAAYNETANDVNAIKSTIGGELVIK